VLDKAVRFVKLNGGLVGREHMKVDAPTVAVGISARVSKKLSK
jgi:hypothetical protein